MAFFGKKFKKSSFENLDEFFEAINTPEKIRVMMKNTEVLTTFTKNDDGSIQSVTSKDGQEVFTHKLVPDVETEFTAPDGNQVKAFNTFKDDRIESVLSFPDGSKIHLERVFEGDSMKLISYKEGVDIKGIITHVAV